ncbi:MAG TPA: SCO family protein [Xanthobacteraceae bacterium]|nr:SCO family protein [Xanthobacteraceae bacterium]
MTVPTNRVLLLLAAFLTGLVICLGGILYLTKGFSPASIAQSAAVGGPFQLTDQDGRTITDESLRGKPFLVFFGFTHCPDVCPTTLFEVSEIMKRLGPDADRTAALFISVDPERDTPEKIKDYLSSFDPHLRGATGKPETVAAIAKAYRVYFKKIPTTGDDYTMDHTAIVYLMDKNGRFVAPFNMRRTPEAAADDLRRYL